MNNNVYEQALEFKRKYPLTIGWRLKNNSRIVEKHLHPDEIVKYVFVAQKNDNPFDIISTAVIAITNERIVIGRDRVVIGYFFDSITPDLFNDLKVTSGIIWGKIYIDTVKELVSLSNISKDALDEIQEKISCRMMMLKKNVYNERRTKY